jgi:hypothetical protein
MQWAIHRPRPRAARCEGVGFRWVPTTSVSINKPRVDDEEARCCVSRTSGRGPRSASSAAGRDRVAFDRPLARRDACQALLQPREGRRQTGQPRATSWRTTTSGSTRSPERRRPDRLRVRVQRSAHVVLVDRSRSPAGVVSRAIDHSRRRDGSDPTSRRARTRKPPDVVRALDREAATPSRATADLGRALEGSGASISISHRNVRKATAGCGEGRPRAAWRVTGASSRRARRVGRERLEGVPGRS